MPTPHTIFASKRNPWTGAPILKTKHVDIASLRISDDPIPAHRASPENKYATIFKRLKPGQCVVCKPEDAPKIGLALKKWAEAHHPNAIVRTMSHHPKDELGRVWMLDVPNTLTRETTKTRRAAA